MQLQEEHLPCLRMREENSMPFEIVRSDITKIQADAIVNPTDSRFSGSGGADYAIHKAAGPLLRQACEKAGTLHQSEIVVTDGYDLPCRYVFHTMGPIWTGGRKNEAALLRACYLNALLKAGEMGLSSVAFPLISSGTFGFPKNQVLSIATMAIRDYLTVTDGELRVLLCVYDKTAYEISQRLELERFLCFARETRLNVQAPISRRFKGAAMSETAASTCYEAMPCEAPQSLNDWLKQQDDTFAVTLLKLIDRKHMTEVQCYKRANVSKKTFWKINNDPKYKPSKPTVLAFAIALKLNLQETEDLLRTVGFSLSHSSTFDMIIEFYIRQGIYDIYEINAALYQFDQVCLGC